MPENLDLPTFSGLLGQKFEIELDSSGLLALELIQATGLESASARSDSKPFILVFRGPADIELPQGTYDLQNATLGRVAIFMVPVSQEESGRLYEAVFN